jgi:hypothetical protein
MTAAATGDRFLQSMIQPASERAVFWVLLGSVTFAGTDYVRGRKMLVPRPAWICPGCR